MLNNFDYLWKRLLCVCVCVCVNSTFGRCCDCCKKKETLYFKIDEADQGEVIKKCFNNTWYNNYNYYFYYYYKFSNYIYLIKYNLKY